jgi:dipeptidyl aminopeptidase/acylaminoacyl peptidase
MDDPRSVIERTLTRVGSESYTLESFYRKRERKRARQRFTAGIVGLSIAIVIAVVGSAILRSAPEDKDVGGKGRQILRNGEVLQLADDYVTLVATDRVTGHQRILHRCDECGYVGQFALSAEGDWIAYTPVCGGGCTPDELGLWVVDADGPATRVTTTLPWTWAWSPTRDQLAFVDRSVLPELVLFDPATDERTSITKEAGISALSWSPDGTAIAIASSSSGLSIIALGTGRSTGLGPVREGDVMSWSPDGTRLVLDEVREDRNRIVVVNADASGRRVLVDQDVPVGLGAPAWSPDGTRIAYVRTPLQPGSTGRFSFEVWVIGADGADATRLFHGDCCIGDGSGPVWSPDGTRLAFFDDVDVRYGRLLVVNADGSGSPKRVDELEFDGWLQGSAR